MNKKGLELTMTVLVLLVISILIFGSSVYLLRQIYKGTEQISNTIDQNTENELRSLLASGSIVALPQNAATTRVKQDAVYWIGVKNMLGSEEQFGVHVSFSRAFNHEEEELVVDGAYINERWLFGGTRHGGLEGPFRVKNNDMQFRDLMILPQARAGENIKTPKGIYFFNVCVFNASRGIHSLGTCDETLLQTPHKLYPPGKMFSVSMEIR